MAKNQTTTNRQRQDNADAQAQGTAQVEGEGGSRRAAPKAKAPKEYRATARGYVDGRIIEAGERFVTTAEEGSWMEPVKGKSTALDRAVSDTQAPMSDDPDLETFSLQALQAEALRLGLTNASGLSKDDLIAAIRAGHDEDRAR